MPLEWERQNRDGTWSDITGAATATSEYKWLHLKNIFKEGELYAHSVTEKFSVTANDGKSYVVKHYNPDSIISVGYHICGRKCRITTDSQRTSPHLNCSKEPKRVAASYIALVSTFGTQRSHVTTSLLLYSRPKPRIIFMTIPTS